MKIEIHTEKPAAERVLRVKLITMNNGVRIIAVDEDGDEEEAGAILSLYPDKGVVLHSMLSNDLGLPFHEGTTHVAYKAY